MRIVSLLLLMLAIRPVAEGQRSSQQAERRLWLQYMDKVAQPVIRNLANDELKVNMPVEVSTKAETRESRSKVTYLEAFGRTLSGIAPWLGLEGGDAREVALRSQYRDWVLKALKNATDSSAKDYMVWDQPQSLVDASFLALGLIRCPWIWEHLDPAVQKNVVRALNISMRIRPPQNNWILFPAVIETFFCKYHLAYDSVPVHYAVNKFFSDWYAGDGLFSDGREFHLDYYNSIVIHPFLTAIFDVATANGKYNGTYAVTLDTAISRYGKLFDATNERYAVIQERTINADGSYPVFGRSITYRAGVFHHLADIALRKELPASLVPSQVRCALTAVLGKSLDAPSTFNESGWLNIGLHGHQPGLAESYIATGSLYLCCDVFLPLGLPETDPFWAGPDQPWTSVKIWSGQDVPADHALDIRK